MKTLNEFVKENDSIRNAAKKLKKAPSSVHDWMHSPKKHFVSKVDGKLEVLAVK
jgi:transposase